MANLPETPQWEDGIYQIEVSDPVLGGPDGISNRQGKQLASRTLYLKQQVEKGGSDLAKHIAAADPHTQYAPKASPTFTGTPTAPTPANSDNSKKLATTEFVVKSVASLDEKNQTKYLPKAGGDITGQLGVAGKLEVGKSETESVIALGSSNFLRDNGKKALVISSESGAGSTAGIYLRPIGSTDSSIELHGSSSGWNFTGTPTATTPSATDNSSKLATTQFVARAIANLAGSAPETLDTLKELADALGNDPNFATTVLNKLTEKLAKDQNGADIPDPALFVKNLGLGELSIAGVSGGSLTASGYITIPMIINGARRALYIQWGGFTGNTDSSGSNGIYENSNITVTWPVAFPNAVFQVITGGSADVGGAGQQEMAWSLGKTKTYGNFGFQCRTPNASMTGSYLVIGY
ncbi:gp53-like domain-containing protein [Klebsiella aerogenes]|uniref:gp53-like domain-containing protein n=1 Tax=Klebsiella aerogenes TaxID=548 RepID=UPI002A7F9321|nr:hypothetical protein [Klebsiella aerogenes]WPS40336.1 hypothetical protein SM910_12165 [Klebsiella aerogenes]